MATQLKHADFSPIPVSATGNYTGFRSPRPNIRVAFSAGPAALAVREKAAETPDAGKTLEEIADTQLPFRPLLAERNAIISFLNGEDAPIDDATHSALCSAINRAENVLLDGTAHTKDDVIVRLIALAQVAAEGHEVGDVEAARAIVDAQHHFGIGYVHNMLMEQLPTGSPPPVDQAAWQSAYDLYCSKRAERRLQEVTDLEPAAARYFAVEALWPSGKNVSTDPVALAALDATGIDAAQDVFDELVMIEHDALMALLATPAPSASELATKLDIFVAEEGWALERSADPIRVIRDDARRIAGHGTLGQDEALLAAFAARRAEAAYWLQPDAAGGEEIEVRSDAATAEAEEVLFGTSASTIEGVIAKLRALFPLYGLYAYSEHALVDPSHPEFRAGLAAGNGSDELLWDCIEDLARIGGVNLSEQGR